MTFSTTETLISPTNKLLSQHLFTRRSIIPNRNDVLWRIKRGIVRTLTWNEDGTSITLGYWGLGDIVGYPLSKVTPYQIECLTSVEATIIPPHLWHEDIKALLYHIQQAEELLSILHRKPTSLKLWQFLVWLGEKFGRDLEHGRLIDLNITHQDISEVLNTTRVTVTRLLQKFEEEGKILRHKRSIVLNLPTKFTRIEYKN
ncbi:Crp/Fnr family transcriptional regulator [Anabaena sphaerica FACHB-251]|uniref:Crp/Fnr family transcriptional regulator n=1 Tax=Anabaena sphaerica FACHB-251 TaxID=2692883 RepID=A0A927A1Q2_9NOST|nr:Crp/Fnr family transcriptional regulator [Anabaena sphaerica]MBD2293720.1 Crp/Fnr family transcriptional regulator [Anabaena sphaerica FACHB-251]